MSANHPATPAHWPPPRPLHEFTLSPAEPPTYPFAEQEWVLPPPPAETEAQLRERITELVHEYLSSDPPIVPMPIVALPWGRRCSVEGGEAFICEDGFCYQPWAVR